MPTQYKRKLGSTRGSWCENDLKKAIDAVKKKCLGINEAARCYNIPKTTLKRKIKKDVLGKGSLGRNSVLGPENEQKIANHIKKLQASGFTPCRDTVRAMAFKLANQLGLQHTFNCENEMAGYDWLKSFMRRNPNLSIRKSEGISKNRALGMNKSVVKEYFDLLEETIINNDLINKPGHIFNMDESGLQLNNKPGQVIAVKGSKCVGTITSGEKGETISVVSCFNGEGNYIPPYCIFKGKNKKEEFSDGMPPGSAIVMNQKSAYMNSDIFYDWLKTQFLPRKPPGKVLLILDGHSSHCGNVEMLEFAKDNDIVLLGLPSHTTHLLQPLDRTFFKSLKSYYNVECNKFIKNNPSRQINRLQFGKLLGSAWSKSATVENALSGFRSCGVIPLNMSAIPDYAFLAPDQDSTASLHETVGVSQIRNSSTDEERNSTNNPNNDIDDNIAIPSTSKDIGITQFPQPEIDQTTSLTPSKILSELTPIPILKKKITARGKAARVAKILNSPDSIENIVKIKEKKENLFKGKEERKRLRDLKRSIIVSKNEVDRPRSKIRKKSSYVKCLLKKPLPLSPFCKDSDDEGILTLNENECVGCLEDYDQTTKTEDWVKCVKCSRWMHENCTKYGEICDNCGKRELKNKRLKTIIKKENK